MKSDCVEAKLKTLRLQKPGFATADELSRHKRRIIEISTDYIVAFVSLSSELSTVENIQRESVEFIYLGNSGRIYISRIFFITCVWKTDAVMYCFVLIEVSRTKFH